MSAVRELTGCRLVRPLLGGAAGAAPRAARTGGSTLSARPEQPEPGSSSGRACGPLPTCSAAARSMALSPNCGPVARRGLRANATSTGCSPAPWRCIPRGLPCSTRRSSRWLTPRPPSGCSGGSPLVSARRAIRRGGRGWRGCAPGWRRGPMRARTLGGCRFVPWRGRLLVLRELAAAGAAVRLQPGARLCVGPAFRRRPGTGRAKRLDARLSRIRAAGQRRSAAVATCRASSIRFCRACGMTRVWRRCRISATVAPAWGRCHRFLSVLRSRLHKRALQLFNRGSILSFACAETPARFERARCPRR